MRVSLKLSGIFYLVAVLFGLCNEERDQKRTRFQSQSQELGLLIWKQIVGGNQNRLSPLVDDINGMGHENNDKSDKMDAKKI